MDSSEKNCEIFQTEEKNMRGGDEVENRKRMEEGKRSGSELFISVKNVPKLLRH